MFAPQIDNIIEWLNERTAYIDKEIYETLKTMYSEFSSVKPTGDDEKRSIWLEIERGSIDDFGEYEDYKEEEVVETYGEFERLWRDFYPDKTKWYEFATAKYKDEMFFYFDSRLLFSIKENENPKNEPGSADQEIKTFLNWLLNRIRTEVAKLEKDEYQYNLYLRKNLSYNKRFGRIKRRDLWDILNERELRLDEKLGSENIKTLHELVDLMNKGEYPSVVSTMTADDFFKYCEIGYDANAYFKNAAKDYSPKEKYLRMADGRDSGLRNIESNSESVFLSWYKNKTPGSHPWEICAGGNSTHISLHVSPVENGWVLRLAGSSVVRVEETVRMAVALYKNNVPFILHEANEILNMVTGNDYIGIVPDYVFPRYCHEFFPKEDKIIDFMQLEYDYQQAIIANAYWYPLEKVELDTT